MQRRFLLKRPQKTLPLRNCRRVHRSRHLNQEEWFYVSEGKVAGFEPAFMRRYEMEYVGPSRFSKS